MKKILCISLLLLANACSIGRSIPYAEDIQPFSVAQNIQEDDCKKSALKDKDYIEEISDLGKISDKTEYIKTDEKTAIERPKITSVPEGEFPNIKNIPDVPKNFPSIEEVANIKAELLEKTYIPAEKTYSDLTSAFTGLDDELLIYTTTDIIEKGLPIEYKEKRDLLATSIGQEIKIKDLEALELIVKDRMRNLKPMLISFYGEEDDIFKYDTIGTILLMGMDPSLIYITHQEIDAPVKAEVSLYY